MQDCCEFYEVLSGSCKKAREQSELELELELDVEFIFI